MKIINIYYFHFFLTVQTLKIEAHLDTLINEQATYVLTRAALTHIYSCVQQHTTEQVRPHPKTLSSPEDTGFELYYLRQYLNRVLFTKKKSPPARSKMTKM